MTIAGISTIADQTALVAKVNASVTMTISDTAPSSPASGDLWFDSTRGALFIYYDSTWVELGAVI